jgi:hypothetical protein
VLENEEKSSTPNPKVQFELGTEANPELSNGSDNDEDIDIGEVSPSRNELAWTKVARRRGKEIANGPGGSILK